MYGRRFTSEGRIDRILPMRCPFCKKDNDKVIDSRSADEGRAVRRRRECLECHRSFTTYEHVAEAKLDVSKKDGRREVFDREKVKRGLMTACKKRPVALDKIEAVVAKVEGELYDKGEREVRASVVGDILMRELKKLDHVAYVRFASVYREFKD